MDRDASEYIDNLEKMYQEDTGNLRDQIESLRKENEELRAKLSESERNNERAQRQLRHV